MRLKRWFHEHQPRRTPPYRAESGQAIVLIALMMVGLIGMTGLAIDGGGLFVLQRTAQKVADIAALNVAVLRCTDSVGDINDEARSIALRNGLDPDDPTVSVIVNNPPESGPNAGDMYSYEVIVSAQKPSYFIHVVYGGPLQVTARAVTRCGTDRGSYDGNVLVATATDCGSQTLHVTGSDQYFEGSFWSNDDVQINTGGMQVDGAVSYVGEDQPYGDGGGWPHASIGGNPPRFESEDAGKAVYKQNTPITAPLFDIADYRPGGSKAQQALNDAGRYTVLRPSGAYLYTGPGIDTSLGSHWYNWENAAWNTNQVPRSGLIYVPGDFGMSGAGIFESDPDIGLTIVAEGRININGPGVHLNKWYMDGIALYSNQNIDASGQIAPGNHCEDQVIMTPSADTVFHGLIYAPGGRVLVPTSSARTPSYGAIIAYTIGVYVNFADIRYQADHLPARPPVVAYAE